MNNLFKGHDNILQTTSSWEEVIPLFLQYLMRKDREKKGKLPYLIITEDLSITKILKKSYLQLKTLYKDIPEMICLDGEKSSITLLEKKNLEFIAASSEVLIDQSRRHNICLKTPRNVIIFFSGNFPERGVDKDLFYIFSKIQKKIHTVVLSSKPQPFINFMEILHHPTTTLFSDWYYSELTSPHFLQEKQEVKKKPDTTQERIKIEVDEICRKIKEEENPEELNTYRLLVKKSIPFGMKSYVTAYLLKNYLASRNEVTKTSLFISAGKNRRLYPKDIVSLLSKVESVSRNDIGEIKILDSYSFVNVSEDKAGKIINQMNGVDYHGKSLTINYARKKTSRAF